jgi:hypothetical protein
MESLDGINYLFFSSAPKTAEEISEVETLELPNSWGILEADEVLIWMRSIAELGNLKTILVPDNVFISTDKNCSRELPVDMLDDLIQSGINIDFKEKKGGYLSFDLKYGVGENHGSSDGLRENSFPFTELGLIKNFSDLLDIYKNPQEFIDKLDGEDLYGLFKKIEDDIGEECGFDGDEYLEITGLYGVDYDDCIWKLGADNEDEEEWDEEE